MTAEEILSKKTPGELFAGPNEMKDEYKVFAFDWHPDRNKDPKASEVMSHVNQLFQTGTAMAEKGMWISPTQVLLKDKHDDTTYAINYMRASKFELGEMFISKGAVSYIVTAENHDLCVNATQAMGDLKYSSKSIQEEFSRCLPSVVRTFSTTDGRTALVLQKPDDVFWLRDILDCHKKNPIPEWDRHVAWIMSSLHNILCYLQYEGMTHNAICVDNYFISPANHMGLLLGGWWYYAAKGTALKAVPDFAFHLMSPIQQRDKEASFKLDHECVRALGRELLGSTSLAMHKAAPEPMVNWLFSACTGDAFKDFANWRKVLEASFGPRKFVKLDITAEMLYK